MNLLASSNRSKVVESISQNNVDLLVVGGGVTGAGIALDAASRGLKVILVEKNDFASGTSSKSTKLIHGGLRYLKQLEINLVREVGSERAIVHRLAPHLVVPEKMLLPLIEGGTLGYYSTSFALKVYDVLAGVGGEDKRRMLSKKETLTFEPLLRQDILKSGGIYAEYRTDDARLTIELIKKAASFGAISLNYVRVDNFIYDQGKIKGANCTDLHSNNSLTINAKYVISATGPWVDQLRKKDKSLTAKHLFLSKGVHLVVPYEKLPLKQSIYFDVPDGRMIFTIPRHRTTYIGTTDTPYKGDINKVLTNREDVNYLIQAVNNMFPSAQLKVEDVESSWAGLRPLIFEEGKSASEISRKDEIFESKSGLLSIAGGKLTGYRKMAERIVDMVADRYEDSLKKDLKDCYTESIRLSDGSLKNAEDVIRYKKELLEILQPYNLEQYTSDYLVHNYGKQATIIIDEMIKKGTVDELALIRAEMNYCMKHELILSIADFFIRRTGRLYFDINSVKRHKETILSDFQNLLNWDDEKRTFEAEQLDQAIFEASNFELSKV